MVNVTYPISEVFVSPQGEGHWLGTQMTFIRFAGCNVGKPYTPDARETLGLRVYQTRCTAWNGESFACDTDYRVKQHYSVIELLELPEVANAERVIFTGGEPLIHDLRPLTTQLLEMDKQIHLETSGTIDWVGKIEDEDHPSYWICVSPKQGYIPSLLERADEVKVLIDKSTFDEIAFIEHIVNTEAYADGRVCISGVNAEHTINEDNSSFCVLLQQNYPKLRLTLQAHKLWRVR